MHCLSPCWYNNMPPRFRLLVTLAFPIARYEIFPYGLRSPIQGRFSYVRRRGGSRGQAMYFGVAEETHVNVVVPEYGGNAELERQEAIEDVDRVKCAFAEVSLSGGFECLGVPSGTSVQPCFV